MTITPGELLETSIAQLRTLVAFLGEQLDGSAGGDTAQSNTREVRACKNMLVSLTDVLQHTPGLGSGGEQCRATLNSNHRGPPLLPPRKKVNEFEGKVGRDGIQFPL